jgi:hypothetical protein
MGTGRAFLSFYKPLLDSLSQCPGHMLGQMAQTPGSSGT